MSAGCLVDNKIG